MVFPSVVCGRNCSRLSDCGQVIVGFVCGERESCVVAGMFVEATFDSQVCCFRQERG